MVFKDNSTVQAAVGEFEVDAGDELTALRHGGLDEFPLQ